MAKNKSGLRAMLEGLQSLPKRFFTSSLSHNLGIKFFSLVLAILFWLFVMDQANPEITRSFENIPIRLINAGELEQNNLKIMGREEYFATVEVVGRRNTVMAMNGSNVSLWADMRTVRSGLNTLLINSSVSSDSVAIKSMTPKEISMTVDRIVSVPKPIKITFSDDFQEGYFERGRSTEPSEIKVLGPESIVNTVSYLGARVAVNTVTAPQSREVTLSPYTFEGEIVSGVTLETDRATLTLDVGKERTVPVMVDLKGNVQEQYRMVKVRTLPETVVIRGPVEAVDKVDALLTAPVQLTGEEIDSFVVEKDIVIPEGISVVSVSGPVQIDIDIERLQSKTFSLKAQDIPIVDLNARLKAELVDPEQELTVTLVDIQSVLETVSQDALGLNLNFEKVETEGIYRMKVNMSTETPFDAVTVSPQTVEVRVTLKE